MPEMLLSRVRDIVSAQIGLHFPPERLRDLECGISLAAREFGFADAEACIQWLLASPLTRNQVEVLAGHLTVGETYFFREKIIFELLEKQILPELIYSRRGTNQHLRIWSAGCASGEEPYSIAILLHKLIPDLERWNITILATDINPRVLQKALRGIYADWSFRDTPPWVREGYFKKTEDGRLQILPSIQKMVSFSHLNLVGDAYPSLCNNTNAMDVIFCRNVLMYFAPKWQKNGVENLHCSLVEGGWLFVSPTEASHILFSQFRTVNFPSAILYRKDSDKATSVDVFPSYVHEKPTSWLQPTTMFVSDPEPAPAVFPEFPEMLPPSPGESQKEDVQPSPYQLALTLYQQGRYSVAVKQLGLWLSQNQNDSNAMNLLARVYANQGRLETAFEWCEKAIAADKLNTGCHYLRAMILQEQGMAEGSQASLKRTLYLDPKFVMAYFSLGNLTLRLRKVKEADNHFGNALSLLQAYRSEDILPESDGIAAGRLMDIIQSTVYEERFASRRRKDS